MGFHEVLECSITFCMLLSPSIRFYALFFWIWSFTILSYLILSYLILSYLILSFWSSACQLGSGVGMTSNIQEVILMCDNATSYFGSISSHDLPVSRFTSSNPPSSFNLDCSFLIRQCSSHGCFTLRSFGFPCFLSSPFPKLLSVLFYLCLTAFSEYYRPPLSMTWLNSLPPVLYCI